MPDRLSVAVLAAAVALVACGGGSGDPSTVPPAPSPAATATTTGGGRPTVAVDDVVDGERLVGALCDATAAATAAEAERAFMSGAHGPLHDLARQVVEIDRDVAARLHEAKQRAEVALDDGDRDPIARDLAALTAETRRSLDVLGQPTPGCGERNP